MSFDATSIQLTEHGTVHVSPLGIEVIGFDGEKCSCRDVAALALVWAIGELQRELAALIEKPGGNVGRVVVS